MKSLAEYITEQLNETAEPETQNIDEALTKESAIVAAIILAASFCVPNALGLIWQLGKYGFKMINRKKFLEELPDLTTKEKERILELTKDMREGSFNEYLEKIEKAETPEEITAAIEEFHIKLRGTVWDPSVAGDVGVNRWHDIKKETETIYDRNKEMSKKADKKLHLEWTVDPLDWLMFIASIGSSSGRSHRSSSGRSGGGFKGFGGGRFGGGGASGSW